MLKSALVYAEMGFRVFPCLPKDKKPLIKEWQNKATTDPDTIGEWWTKTPDANIGVATGHESGFFVLDVDTKEQKVGNQSFTALEAEIGPLPDTLEAKTGTGGRHLLFKMPKRDVRNKTSFRPDLDIRGNGGYILVAPSVHPETGQRYMWPCDFDDPIAEAPEALLDIICPLTPELPLQEPVKAISRPPDRPGSTPIIERASLYLKECEPASQGAGGHDALLWAARAMVVGFELSPAEARSLLWNDFNPRCNPPWDRSKPSDVKDFDRKIDEVQKTPGQKPRGWLLDECGLRSDDEALHALGSSIRDNLLAGFKPPAATPPAQPAKKKASAPPAPWLKSELVNKPIETNVTELKFESFPMECLPPRSAEYGILAADAHCVDSSFTGLPMLIVAGAAMGNAFRLKLKQGFMVPPTLWGGIVAASGTNKSGPLQAITEPLRAVPTIDNIADDEMMLNPQCRMIVSDATLEAVVSRLGVSPRGLCTYRNELAGWIKSFNAYRKGGGDEQAWIEFWDAHEYQLDRKTNAEDTFIPAAAVSIIGGIQPKVLAECFDPGKFASGLVPRLLITHPPIRKTSWTEVEIGDVDQSSWNNTIMLLRTRPFKTLTTDNARYMPHILTLSPTAYARYVEFFDELSEAIVHMDEMSQTFASKTRVIAARLALVHHGLTLAETKDMPLTEKVSLASMEAGIILAKWFLNEQLRVYGLANSAHARLALADLARKIKFEFDGTVMARDLMRKNGRRYKRTHDAKSALDQLVAEGFGTWDEKGEIFTVKK